MQYLGGEVSAGLTSGLLGGKGGVWAIDTFSWPLGGGAALPINGGGDTLPAMGGGAALPPVGGADASLPLAGGGGPLAVAPPLGGAGGGPLPALAFGDGDAALGGLGGRLALPLELLLFDFLPLRPALATALLAVLLALLALSALMRRVSMAHVHASSSITSMRRANAMLPIQLCCG